ncbi:hypothetical protein HKD24_09465 [Gluconobacter sp. LMG 31484]|uniref:Uncharacterized protein n=1 Tax=Gluconobacter vitians TaxID=2728102 RepID=A0ABR9Y673_9PROT|nr:hypothetical protein [Gluconobacter vitians]MBF0859442.1 hypothetical protein [Gluconobacter vitians]
MYDTAVSTVSSKTTMLENCLTITAKSAGRHIRVGPVCLKVGWADHVEMMGF